MIPATYPTFTNPFNGFGDCKISYLSSVSGLVAWTDYIPVRTVVASTSIEGRTEANGYQNVHPVGATGNVAWTDYIPVYEDATKTVPWSTDANGYIPVGLSEDGVLGFLSEADVQLELTHTAVPTAGSIVPSFTRATTETGQRWDEAGYLDFTALVGEMIFKGARRERNVIQENVSLWGVSSNTTLGTGVSDPDGGTTAFTVTATGASGIRAVDVGGSVVVGSWVSSIYIRRRTGTGAVSLYNGKEGAAVTALTGSLTTSWQRLSSLVSIATVPSNNYFGVLLATSGDAVDVWHPQLEDVTAQTTQTAGEYVSVGVVQRNKCLYSSDFSGWTAVGTPTRTAAANTSTGVPLDLIGDNSAADLEGYTQSVTFTGDGTKSVSLYVKAGTSALSQFRILDVTAGTNRVNCAVTWTAGVPSLSFFAGSQESAPELISDGVYRLKVVATGVVAANNNSLQIYPATNGLGVVETGTVYAGGVQAENNATATEYQAVGGTYPYHGSMVDGVKAYDTDRNGSPISTSGSYPLVGYAPWEARTNLALQSQTFATTWATVQSTVTANQVAAPDGTLTADLLTATFSAGQHSLYQDTVWVSGSTYAISVYAKKGTLNYVAICHTDGSSEYVTKVFDLNLGVVGETKLSAGDTLVSASITPAGNGFYRCEVVATVSATGAIRYTQIALASAATGNTFDVAGRPSWNASGTENLYLWGAQVELGSFATPYIPTTTIAVARNADVLTYTGADVALLKTLACTFAYPAVVNAATNYTVVSVDDGSLTTNSSTMRVAGDTLKLGTLTFSGSVLQSLQAHTNVINSASHKCAITWPANGIISVIDGGDAKTDASNTPPAGLTTLRIGVVSSGQNLNGSAGGIYGWTRNLSQSELNAITA